MRLTALLICAAFPVSNAMASADGPDFFTPRDALSAPLHKAQDTRSAVLATIGNGAILKNQGCVGVTPFDQWQKLDKAAQAKAKDKIWCKISYMGQTGWVKNTSLEEAGQMPTAPNFDCTKADGEVEHMICGDASLTALDNDLMPVYNAAIEQASNLDAGAQEAVDTLKAVQRGWVKGRNECWKAIDTSIRDCVKARYEHRISQLQAQWGLIHGADLVRYTCGQAGEEFAVTFYESLLAAARVDYGDKTEIFVSVPAASGSKYEGEFGKVLWIKGDEAMFTWDQALPEKHCKLAP